MKTKNIIITALALLTIVPTASAQQEIKEAFEEVAEDMDVTKVGEQKTSKVDAKGITVESNVVTFKVKGQNIHHAVFGRLKKAFENESIYSSMFEEETGNEKVVIDLALGNDTGQRRQWSIWRDGAEPILVGGMKNSCYTIAIFNDKEHEGYRTCYAAEWSNADAPDVYTTKLVYVYGRQPEASDNQPFTINGRAIPNLPDDLMNRLHELQIQADSIPSEMLERFFFSMPRDIPFGNDGMDGWMNRAMNNISHLSNSDWHRLFGLITQKLLDSKNVISVGIDEERIVAAGVLLDLCKHADKLDEDEREISAKRLRQIANSFTRNEYVRDLLMLGADKLQN